MVEDNSSSPSSAAANRERASSAPDVSLAQGAVSSPASAATSNGAAGGVAFSPSSPSSRSPSSPVRYVGTGAGIGPRTPGLDSPTPDEVSHPLPSVTQSLPPKLTTGPGTGTGIGKKSTSQRQFELCTTLYKRRGGFGRNAENNWVKRCFTLHGPILCYYDTAILSGSDPSRPRGRLNLSKEDTRAEMSTKYGTHSPTEFLVTLNLYVLGSKRKWELCCLNAGDQRKWYDALRVYDGPPVVDEGGVTGAVVGAFAPGGGGKQSSSDEGAPQNRRTRRQTIARESSESIRTRMGLLPPMQEDERGGGTIIETAPSYDSTGAMENTPLVSNRRRHHRRTAKPGSTIDQHVVVSFLAINVAVCFAKFGDDLTFYLSIIMTNIVLYFLLDHLMKREEVRRLRHGGSGSSGGDERSRLAANRARLIQVESYGAQEQGRKTAGVTSPSAVRRLKAGSTIPRASVKSDSPSADILTKAATNNEVTAETVAAYAAATASDYDVQPFSYWNVDASTFNLRTGPNYKREKKKAPSGPALFDLYAMDAVQDDCILKSTEEGFEIPNIPGVTDIDTGCPDVPPMLVVTVNIPTEEPAMFGGEADGPSCIIIMYFTIAKHTLEELKNLDTASTGTKLFVEYCRKAGSDEKFRGRFKALAVVEEMESLGFPSFITSYNGKPALVTKSGKFTRHENYAEMTVNVHMWAYLAKKGLYMLRDEFPRFNVNIGFTIEGRKDEELPEVLLGGCRVMEFDLNKVASAPGSEKEEALENVLVATDSWS